MDFGFGIADFGFMKEIRNQETGGRHEAESIGKRVGGTRLRQSFGAAWGIGHRAEGIEERRKAIWVIRLRRH